MDSLTRPVRLLPCFTRRETVGLKTRDDDLGNSVEEELTCLDAITNTDALRFRSGHLPQGQVVQFMLSEVLECDHQIVRQPCFHGLIHLGC